MSARLLAVDVLVALGVGGVVACCVGLVVMRDAFARLHYAGAAAVVPPWAIAAAVLVQEGFDAAGLAAIAVALLLLAFGAVLGTATARAAVLNRFGSFEAAPAGEEAEPS